MWPPDIDGQRSFVSGVTLIVPSAPGRPCLSRRDQSRPAPAQSTIGEDNRVLPADDHSAGQRGHTALTQKGLRNVGRRRGNGHIMAGSASDSLACLPVDPVVPGPAFTQWGYR